MKKIVLFFTLCTMLLLSGCGSVALQDTPENTPVPTQSAENKAVGKESEKRVNGGVKLTMENTDDKDGTGLLKTISSYMYEGEKLISIKNECIYKSEEKAKENAEKFITMPQSCVDVSQSGDTVTYYASVSAMEFMQDMKKEDIVKMAESIGALAEEY